MGYSTLKELFEAGIVKLARLPMKNEFEISALDDLAGYTVPLIAHDYGAKTPVMWNTVYESLGLSIRNIMVVADPKDLPQITEALRKDPKYLGGGAGVGFKETVVEYLDSTVPDGLNSVNIVVKEGSKLVGYNTDARGLLLSIKDELVKLGKGVDSNYVLFGAGGVAKPFAKELAKEGAKRISIVNRTVSKGTVLAQELSRDYPSLVTYAVPEDLIRGNVLNTIVKPDVIVNCTEKGADGPLVEMSAFAPAHPEYNNTISLEILRRLKEINPAVVIVDIVLPKAGADNTVTLRHARVEKLEHLVNGLGMVINQAGPAYKLIEKAHSRVHAKMLSEDELRKVMQQAARSV
ncbi:hypothetical protein J4219_05320 [Candidatus Woesearchaeota archaeon]|nr:hypothetical protein [Candidatus Woesearchaeota archaeon]